MPIRELTVAGYRSVYGLRLSLGDVNVLTGPNGCGKSNLYQAVFLLAKAAYGGFAQAIAEEGGMPSVLWAGVRRTSSATPSRKVPVRMRLVAATEMFAYELACGLPKPLTSAFDLDPEVKEEYVWLGGSRTPSNTMLDRSANGVWIRDADGARVSYSGELLASDTALSQLREPHLYPELSALRCEMGRWRFYHHFRTDPASPLRHPRTGVRTTALSHDGSDLAAALQTIREIGDSEDVDAEIERAFPGATLAIDYSQGFAVQMRMPGVIRPLAARELSDGTLRYLCLLAALMSPRPPTLLALNEPEGSLHPDLLDPLARLIARAGRRSQLWITTHSPLLSERIAEHSGHAPIRLKLVNGETVVEGQRLVK